jgi:hypothetical protein
MAAIAWPRSAVLGLADLPKQGFRDHAVERHDYREVSTSEQIMGQNQRGCGHVLATVRWRNIDDNTEIQVMVIEARNQPLWRLAEHRE